MVSRRKILSRSRDDLTLGEERAKHTQVQNLLSVYFIPCQEQNTEIGCGVDAFQLKRKEKRTCSDIQDDTWYSKEKLYKDHVEEVRTT